MDRLTAEQQKIVENNMNLVHYILQNKVHIKPSSQEYEDCFQEGCLGLCNAVLKFNEDLGYKLSTYASGFIWGYIMRYRRDNRYIIKYPRSISDAKSRALMYMVDNPDASFDKMISDLKLNNKQVLGLISTISYIEDLISTDLDGDSDTSPYDYIKSYNDKSLEDQLDMSMIYDDIDECIDRLKFANPRARNIFAEYIYDLMYIEEKRDRTTQSEYSSKYSYAQPSVARIIGQGLQQLRKLLKEMGY